MLRCRQFHDGGHILDGLVRHIESKAERAKAIKKLGLAGVEWRMKVNEFIAKVEKKSQDTIRKCIAKKTRTPKKAQQKNNEREDE